MLTWTVARLQHGQIALDIQQDSHDKHHMIEPSGGQTIYRLVQTLSASQKVQEQIVQLIGTGRLAISERLPAQARQGVG
jgi:hypothetical protein